MATATAAALPSPAYRPAFSSRVLAWIDGLPLHGLWLYPLLAVLLIGWAQAVLWLSGGVSAGSISLQVLQGVFYGPYGLAATAIANRIALRSLDSFWPATGWPDSERASWRYRFATLPRSIDLVALAIGVPVAIAAFLSAPADVLGPEPLRGYVAIAFLPMMVLGYSVFPLAVMNTVRQLRLVIRIHREATAIDPFDREPLYAFSRLTVFGGLSYVGVGYYGLAVNGTFQAGNLVSLGTLFGAFAVGMVTFVVPLWGIHDRLVHEKARLIRDVQARLGRLGDEMYRRVDAGQFDGTKAVGDSIAGVSVLRERIAHLPTWPWPPNLLRGFVTALLLPVIVYVASRLVGGNLGL